MEAGVSVPCRFCSPCPCGCGWGVCGVFGEFIEIRVECGPDCNEFEKEARNEED